MCAAVSPKRLPDRIDPTQCPRSAGPRRLSYTRITIGPRRKIRAVRLEAQHKKPLRLRLFCTPTKVNRRQKEKRTNKKQSNTRVNRPETFVITKPKRPQQQQTTEKIKTSDSCAPPYFFDQPLFTTTHKPQRKPHISHMHTHTRTHS